MLKKTRVEPLWAQLAVGAALALPIGFGMMLVNGLLTGRVSDLGWWRASLRFNLYSCLFVAYSMLAVRRGIEKLLSPASIDALSEGGNWRGTLVINAIAIAGVVLGVTISFTVTWWLVGWNPWAAFLSNGIAKT